MKRLFCLLFALFMCLSACTAPQTTPDAALSDQSGTPAPIDPSPSDNDPTEGESFPLTNIPAYSGKPYVVLEGGVPRFENADLTTDSYERYAPLDALGRCGTAQACVGVDLMPTEERGSIGMVKPSGWHTYKYDFVDGKYLYNRCHLIGFQLSGENANEQNLITGTRSFNTEGMLPFENLIADYVKETNHHVLYRVTPLFEGDDLVCRGVLMEAYSVEDAGEGVEFFVFCYNVEPGVVIDYATGESRADDTPQGGPAETPNDSVQQDEALSKNYVLNTNTKKFHLPSCSSAKSIKEHNRKDFSGTRDEVLSMGYEPCKNCDP